MDKIYTITKRGRKISGDISAKETEGLSILRYLHEINSADIDDISSNIGIPKGKTSRILGKLERNHLVDNLSRM